MQSLMPELTMPVLVIQGDADTGVPVENTRKWIAAMKDRKMDYKYSEIPGGDRGSVIATACPTSSRSSTHIPSKTGGVMFVRLSAILLASAAYAAGACESLSSLKLDNATITSAQIVAAGAFSPLSGRAGRGPNLYQTLPAFCRVQATLTPSSDSDVKVEVWLPWLE